MDWSLLSQYGDRFWDGTLITLKLTFIATLLGWFLALGLALARTSSLKRYWIPAYTYTYIFRGTPLLIQLFILYYGLGQFEAIRQSFLWPVLSDAEWCGLIGLTLNTAAYTAEILRGGMVAVPKGEREAAQSFGMTAWQIQRRIVIPRAIRLSWPAYGNEVVLLLKGSALVSTIAVWDLMGETRSIFSRTYALEIFVYAAFIYFLMTFLLTRLFRGLEGRLNAYLGAQ